MDKDTLKKWLYDNSWNIIVTIVLITVAYQSIYAKVEMYAAKANELEERLNQYPSRDYFEEKFKNLEGNYADLRKDVKELAGNK